LAPTRIPAASSVVASPATRAPACLAATATAPRHSEAEVRRSSRVVSRLSCLSSLVLVSRARSCPLALVALTETHLCANHGTSVSVVLRRLCYHLALRGVELRVANSWTVDFRLLLAIDKIISCGTITNSLVQQADSVPTRRPASAQNRSAQPVAAFSAVAEVHLAQRLAVVSVRLRTTTHRQASVAATPAVVSLVRTRLALALLRQPLGVASLVQEEERRKPPPPLVIPQAASERERLVEDLAPLRLAHPTTAPPPLPFKSFKRRSRVQAMHRRSTRPLRSSSLTRTTLWRN
jgi:hypothetical protein